MIRFGILGRPGLRAHSQGTRLTMPPSLPSQAAIRPAQSNSGRSYNIPSRYGSYDELIGDPAVDAVYILFRNTSIVNILSKLRGRGNMFCGEAGRTFGG